MKIKCNKKEFKLEIFIIVLSIVSILIHLYKIIFMHDKLNTELIITLVFLILVIVAIIFLLNRIYIKVNRGKLYVSSLDLVNKRILKDSINIKDIEKYGFSTDLKLNYNKYDIVLQSKNKKLIISVNQFKNKDILRLLELIEDKTNIKPTGLAKYLRETKKIMKTNVMRILDQKKIRYVIHTYQNAVSGIEVADTLNESYDKVFKTLVTVSNTNNHYVFVVPVNKELDLKKAAKVVGEKSIEMLKSALLLPLTGYIHGGCSPVGMKKQFRTIVDKSASNKDRIFVSGGKIGYQIEIELSELKKVVNFEFEDITKDN